MSIPCEKFVFRLIRACVQTSRKDYSCATRIVYSLGEVFPPGSWLREGKETPIAPASFPIGQIEEDHYNWRSHPRLFILNPTRKTLGSKWIIERADLHFVGPLSPHPVFYNRPGAKCDDQKGGEEGSPGVYPPAAPHRQWICAQKRCARQNECGSQQRQSPRQAGRFEPRTQEF
jgi:hypothetical protein